MENNAQAKRAAVMIISQIMELNMLIQRTEREQDYNAGRERLRRWKDRTANLLDSYVGPTEGDRFRNVRLNTASFDQLSNFRNEATKYRAFLVPLNESLSDHPETILDTPRETKGQESGILSRTVFLVHGHDELNLLKRQKLLKDQWELDSVVLNQKPGSGMTLIERIEEEGPQAGYAFVLFTPDDLVEVSGEVYAQARPNVILELGWFYGRLGRSRVCIVSKKGTKIPSDLARIHRRTLMDGVRTAEGGG